MPFSDDLWNNANTRAGLKQNRVGRRAGLKICRSHQGQGILWLGVCLLPGFALEKKKYSVLQKFRQENYSCGLQDAESLVAA